MYKYKEISDDMIKKFLIEVMLTGDWSEEYHFLVDNATNKKRLPVGDYKYNWNTLFADYVYDMGLLRISKKRNQVYEVSVRGRKWLDARK
jgi:hypothetical protein